MAKLAAHSGSDRIGGHGKGWDEMGRKGMRCAGIRGNRLESAGIRGAQRGWDQLGSVGEAAAKGDESIRIRVSRLSKKTHFMAKNKT